LVTICFGFVAASVALHLVPFIIKLSYSTNIAATALSAFQISAGVTKLTLGALTDSSGVKIAITIAFLGGAVDAMSLVASRHPSSLIIGILGVGIPLLVTPYGGLSSRVSNWATAMFNGMEAFKDEFRCITMDQRNDERW
jgi:hypothetical protein